LGTIGVTQEHAVPVADRNPTDPTGEEPARGADPDSRARTHLANERTFLAWLRTGLSLVALGLASAQFLDHDLVPGFPLTTVFALFLVASGVGLTVLGGIRYAHAGREIEAGALRPSHRVVVAAVAVVLVAGVLAFLLVVLLRVRG
jgi:putative membrane protein